MTIDVCLSVRLSVCHMPRELKGLGSPKLAGRNANALPLSQTITITTWYYVRK